MVRMAWGWALRNEGKKKKNSPVRGTRGKWWIRRCFGVRSLEDVLLRKGGVWRRCYFPEFQRLGQGQSEGGTPTFWLKGTSWSVGKEETFSSLSSALVRGRSRSLVCDWGINNGENPLFPVWSFITWANSATFFCNFCSFRYSVWKWKTNLLIFEKPLVFLWFLRNIGSYSYSSNFFTTLWLETTGKFL